MSEQAITPIKPDFLTCREIEQLERYKTHFVEGWRIKPSPENEDIYGEVNDEDSAMDSLVESIRQLGLEEPIICTLDGYILSGHRRFHAVRRLNWSRVPVRFAQVRRDETQDYHRLLAAYNPQRVKSVASTLSEAFIASEKYRTAESIQALQFAKCSRDDLDIMCVEGCKHVDEIGPRQQEFLAAAVEVVNNLREFWPLDIRTIHYKLVHNPPLTQSTKDRNERWRYRNNKDCYNRLSTLLVAARYRGHVPMHAIDDPTRTSYSPGSGFTDIGSFVRSEVEGFLYGYERNLLEGQPRHVEVLIEKNTLIKIADPVCRGLEVPYSVNRGYGNPSLWRKMERRWRAAGEKPFVLLCLSDHDPEGLDLCDDAIRSLRDLHAVDVEMVRVGVTQEQIDALNVPPALAKEGSSRWEMYVERTGTENAWECEALEPKYLQNVLREAIMATLDVDQLNAVMRREAEEKRQLEQIRKNLARHMNQVAKEAL